MTPQQDAVSSAKLRQALSALLLQSPRGLSVRFRDPDDCQSRLFVHIESGRAWIADRTSAIVEDLGSDPSTTAALLRDSFHLLCAPTALNSGEQPSDNLDFLIRLRTSDQVALLGMERLPGSLAPFQVSPLRQKMDEFAETAAVRMRVPWTAPQQKLLFLLSSLDGKFMLAKPQSTQTRTKAGTCIELQRIATDTSATVIETSGASQRALALTIELDTLALDRACFRSAWKNRELAWLRPHGDHCLLSGIADTHWVPIEPLEVAWQRVATQQLHWPRPVRMKLLSFAIGGRMLEGKWYGLGTNHSLCLWQEASPLVCCERKQSSSKNKSRWQVSLSSQKNETPAVFHILWRSGNRPSSCFLRLCCPSKGARPDDEGVALYLGLEKSNSRLVLKHRPRQWELFEIHLDDAGEDPWTRCSDVRSAKTAELGVGPQATEDAYFARARRVLDELCGEERSQTETKRRTGQTQEIVGRRNAVIDKVAMALAQREAERPARARSGRDQPHALPSNRAESETEMETTLKTGSKSSPSTKDSDAESGEHPQVVQGGTTSVDPQSNLLCAQCRQSIIGQYVRALSKSFHPACFTCSICSRPLAPAAKFRTSLGNPLCETCYAQHIAPRCARCKAPITDLVVTAMERKWHRECLRCVRCGLPLCDERSSGSNRFYLYPGHPDKPHCELCVRGERRQREAPRVLSGDGGATVLDKGRRYR
ncbi:hypothetical protein CCYA_CCYA16G4194 [Cyanidiococcus yangmingshanensis]|nr:hypothetical protein CCYA_CCYA16G4194 [Cyanidiococcus yangmingshanensis]